MVTSHKDDASVSWQMLLIIAGVAGAVAGGAIWLGAVSKQVQVNTEWIIGTNVFLNDVRQHNADTLAREKSFEDRINKIETRFENERRDKKY